MSANRLSAGTVILAATTALGATPCVAADLPVVQGAPTADKGFEAVMQEIVDLGSEIPGMEGRQLRMRLITIQPGGHIRVHSHRNRPAAFYVVQGATTVIYGDGTVKRFAAGSMGHANRKTVHWHRNNENKPVVLVASDVFQRSSDR